MKTRFWSFLLALAMLLTAASFAVPAALAADADPADVDKQIALIYSGLGELVQKDEGKEWFYTVTDLDHNGKLEFIAASQDKEKLTTSLKVWTANDDMTSLEECKLAMKEGETFPDFLTDMADTFHDVKNDAWYYLCYNNEVGGENEFTTYKTAVTLKDKELSFMTFAAEHSVVVFGLKHVAYTDASGASISAEQYNNAGLNNFPGAEKSNTGFEWMKADKIKSLTDLTDAYAVFLGAKKPTESFAAVQPASMQAPDAVPAGGSSYGTPVATPVPGYNPVTPVQPAYLSITKNPTNEGRTTGETAYFVAGANAYDSLYWTFVSPYGGEYSAQNFGSMYPKSPVNGTYSTTLSISGVSKDMNGWGAYCTFYYKGQTARTSTAYLTVYDKPTPTTRPAPAPDPAPSQETGVLYGTVTDYSFSTVTVEVPGKTIATVSFDIVSIDGDLYKGAPATLYWEGMTGKGPSKYTWCFIQGSHAAPEPVYGSMNGTAYHDTAFTIYIVLSDGSGYHVDGTRVNIIGGNDIQGAPCKAYYKDYPSESNIYQIDVYGKEPVIPEVVETPPQYVDEYGSYTPAHPDADNAPYYEDEYGVYTPAHPDADDTTYYEDEYGSYTPAHPDADDTPYYEDEYGSYTPAHPDADDTTYYEDEYDDYTADDPD